MNLHWRKFAITKIPLENQTLFDKWLQDTWHEKDALLESYLESGRFPGEESAIRGAAIKSPEENFIETEVKLGNILELFSSFRILATFAMVIWLAIRSWSVMGAWSKN